jgi:Transmembrane protein 43
MSDQFTKVTSENYFQRLGNSFGGMVFGIILLIIACVLLFWNDGRAVDAQRGLNAGGRAVVNLTTTAPAPANEGKLVHMTGQATATAPLSDGDVGVTFLNTLTLVRKVEMFQWVQETSSSTKDKVGGTQETTTTYTYTKKWIDTAQDSSTFEKPEGHANPAMPFTSSRIQATDAKLGGFALPEAILGQLTSETLVAPDTIPQGWKKVDATLYKGTGSIEAPVVGDIRVTYAPLASGTVISAIGKQTGSALEAWISNNSNYEVLLAQQGMASSALMIKDQKAAEGILTWVLRAVGTLMNIGAFALLMGPLRALGNVIPLVASIIGGGVGMIAFGLGSGLSLIVIAIAWFTFRPLLSIGLLLAAAAAWYFLRSKPGTVPASTTA